MELLVLEKMPCTTGSRKRLFVVIAEMPNLGMTLLNGKWVAVALTQS